MQSTPALYLTTVLIWGSTWYALTFQVGAASAAVSVAWRFAFAALILALYIVARGMPFRFGLRDHAFIALQGALLFGFNYLLFLHVTALLTSGLVAVIFSTIVFMNILNGALWLRRPIEPRVVVGAAVGLTGIGLIFWPEFVAFNPSAGQLHGLLLGLSATLLASFGNMVSVRNQRQGLPVVQTNAFGMAWGAALMAAWALWRGDAFLFTPTAGYLTSMIYLSLFGSVIAFGCYLTLLGRIGPARAAYATVLFPVVALAVSTLFEGYRWSLPALAGMLLILIGNVLALSTRSFADWLPRRRRAVVVNACC